MTAPPPLDAFALQAATWPAAQTRTIGGWTAGFTEGAGRRVSSARPLDPERAWADLAADLPAVEAFYADRGADALAQLPDALIPEAGAALRARGYVDEAPSLILSLDAAALADRPYRIETRPYLIAVEGALASLDELWRSGGVGPERRAVIGRAAAQGRILAARVDHRIVGALFVARAGAAAAAHALHVAPHVRRRGVGGDLIIGAARWARAAAAPQLMIAVEADNAPARALYGTLGAIERGGYRYFRRPAL